MRKFFIAVRALLCSKLNNHFSISKASFCLHLLRGSSSNQSLIKNPLHQMVGLKVLPIQLIKNFMISLSCIQIHHCGVHISECLDVQHDTIEMTLSNLILTCIRVFMAES